MHKIIGSLVVTRSQETDAYLPVTVGTLVGLLSSVDLPVPVEAAGVGQHLAALLALNGRLSTCAHDVSPTLDN